MKILKNFVKFFKKLTVKCLKKLEVLKTVQEKLSKILNVEICGDIFQKNITKKMLFLFKN